MKKIFFPSETFWGIILLTALIFTIFIQPILPLEWQAKTYSLSYTILYFSSILSLEKRVKSLLVLSVIAFSMNWLTEIFSLSILTTVSKSLSILFFIVIAIYLIMQVATSREVSLKVIIGSVIGYLLIGMIYSIFIAFIMIQDPAAFNVIQSPDDTSRAIAHLGESIYFSFVSLATVGYGDIVPIKPYARSLAIWICISGQLYIAIIIALLVGKFASRNNTGERA
ncbi:MAG: ion channel, partial [Bacteroidota bacterium]